MKAANLDKHTRPKGTFVTIRSRDDIDPSSDTVMLELTGKTVTGLPENVGLCQVLDVGPDVTNVKPGDVCFIDFFDVAQAYIVSGEELYLTQAMALRMTLDIQTEAFPCPITKKAKLRATSCEITPLPGYVLTKHAPERMSVAVMGHDRAILPRDQTTRGLVGGRNRDGDPCTFVCYEEVVSFTPGAIQAERYAEDWQGRIHDTYYEERRLKAKIERLENEIRNSMSARGLPYDDSGDAPDLKPGELAVFCSEFSIQFRAMGELYRCTPYKNILSTIDDAAILADFYRKRPPKPLIQPSLLYGVHP